MKLIKMIYDKSCASVRRGLVDCQDMHKNIQQFFGTSREESQVLYRLTKDSIYVSASKEPVVHESNGITVVAIKDVVFPESGDELRFNILTCPYKKIDGHRIPLTDERSRIAWIHRQGEKHGFACLTMTENGSSIIKSDSKKFEVEGHYYSGVLEVTDKELFRLALENGIGAEKAYGFGMMLVV